MFPIKTRYKTGYQHGDKTFYNAAHVGVDLIVPEMTPLHAPEDGIVSHFFGIQGGQWLSLTTSAGKHRFAHLKQYKVASGKRVKKGSIIAYTGGAKGAPYSGNSTAPHVHWDYQEKGKFLDPLDEPWERELLVRVNALFRSVWGRQPMEKESIYFQKRVVNGISTKEELLDKMWFWHSVPRVLFILEMQRWKIF